MADKKTAPLLLNVDASEVLTQFGELLKLVELPASSFEGIPEICLKVKIIGLIEHLTSAVRAHGPHGLHEYILSTVGEIKE